MENVLILLVRGHPTVISSLNRYGCKKSDYDMWQNYIRPLHFWRYSKGWVKTSARTTKMCLINRFPLRFFASKLNRTSAEHVVSERARCDRYESGFCARKKIILHIFFNLRRILKVTPCLQLEWLALLSIVVSWVFIVLMLYGWFPGSLSLSGGKKKKKITGDECLSSELNLGITRRLKCGWLLLGNAHQRDGWPWCGVMTLHLRRLFIKGQVVRWRLARLAKASAMCPLCSINASDVSLLFYHLKKCFLWFFSTKASWAVP